MNKLLLFTDGSVDNELKIGYGAYFIIDSLNTDIESIIIKTQRFENTSSSKLEFQVLIHALNVINFNINCITVYTDSQTIVGLKNRRLRLEKNNYISKSNKLHKNSELYKDFFKLTDKFNIEFIKVKGHSKSSEKNIIEQLFTIVDKSARLALRNNT